MTTALLRLEGAALCLAALAGYWLSGASWWLFAILILAPDLSMLGYLKGPRVGAYAYNCFHVTLWPLALLVGGYLAGSALCVSIGLIWLAHIGIDRALGYGLKLPTDFRDTHLGRIGRG
jgi:hypothetical protein